MKNLAPRQAHAEVEPNVPIRQGIAESFERVLGPSEAPMTSSIQQMREASPAFRQALLKSEKKRILGVIAFVALFAVLAIVRIFVLGSAMSRWSLLAAALVIGFELWLLRAVNRVLRSGEDIANSVWNL